ncbi:MAG TPA: alcohol dehydrogenase catalytic domain-containing protein, partial [Hyphomicrobiaceae bacterium]|nr:alcohol dehydrogenase catalytic domain-containing protein [Hyphomicrobiaceae bacterium]
MLSYRLEKFAAPLTAVKETAPVPVGRQVVVDITASGLCHSDLHLHEGFFDLGDGARIDAKGIVNPPRTLGHEIVGIVD